MKTLILIAFSIALAAGLARADGEDLIGVWEAEDGDQVLVFEFREDGIMIENDYDEGELQCVYVSPYSADGDVVTVGSGLNWEVDPDTGKLVLYEDYENEEIEFIYRANGNDLSCRWTWQRSGTNSGAMAWVCSWST